MVGGFQDSEYLPQFTSRRKAFFRGNSLNGRDSFVSNSKNRIHRKEHDRGNRSLETKHKAFVYLRGMWIHLQVLLWSVLHLILAVRLS